MISIYLHIFGNGGLIVDFDVSLMLGRKPQFSCKL